MSDELESSASASFRAHVPLAGCYSADISRVISDFGLCLHVRDVLKRGHFPGSQERFNLDETMYLPRQVCKRPSRDVKGDGFMTSRHEQALRGRDGIPITVTTLFTLQYHHSSAPRVGGKAHRSRRRS